MEFLDKVFNEDCLEGIKKLPDQSVDCCITSPPYYGLRDYGTGKWIGGSPDCPHHGGQMSTQRGINTGEKATSNYEPFKTVCPLCGAVREDKQIGLEETPEEYIGKLVNLFHEIRRVLKDDGTLWVNVGDSYWGSGSRGYDFTGKLSEASKIQGGSKGTINLSNIPKLVGNYEDIKNKDLIGIPWLLAFALRADGWYLRQDIIWHKPACMPESVTDRCTKSHEYIFLLSKSPRYYFDNVAIQEPSVCVQDNRAGQGRIDYDGKRKDGLDNGTKAQQSFVAITEMRNKRDVWSVNPQPDMIAHFATYPPKLIKPCVLAGCRPGGVVLDPFMGSGTTAKVAIECNRHFVGFELNPKYMGFIEQKIQTTGDLFY